MKNKAYGRLCRDSDIENSIFIISKVVCPKRAKFHGLSTFFLTVVSQLCQILKPSSHQWDEILLSPTLR